MVHEVLRSVCRRYRNAPAAGLLMPRAGEDARVDAHLSSAPVGEWRTLWAPRGAQPSFRGFARVSETADAGRSLTHD